MNTQIQCCDSLFKSPSRMHHAINMQMYLLLAARTHIIFKSLNDSTSIELNCYLQLLFTINMSAHPLVRRSCLLTLRATFTNSPTHEQRRGRSEESISKGWPFLQPPPNSQREFEQLKGHTKC